jgi:hypothetical protein
MPRFYRISKNGAMLPRRHSYSRVYKEEDAQPGFEVFKGPIYSLANTVGPAIGALTEGDFTPNAGYHHFLLIDVTAYQGHQWAPWTWLIVQPEAVTAVYSLAVTESHDWLRQQNECLDSARWLDRERVATWVTSNLAHVEQWLAEHAQPASIQFADTLGQTAQ